MDGDGPPCSAAPALHRGRAAVRASPAGVLDAWDPACIVEGSAVRAHAPDEGGSVARSCEVRWTLAWDVNAERSVRAREHGPTASRRGACRRWS